MQWNRYLLILSLVTIAFPIIAIENSGVRIKDLARLADAKDNALVGYGLVAGLAGTGDSIRSASTLQSIRNALMRFGINVPTDDIRSRNVASVMIAATLPPFAQAGDKLDVNVTSLGDARSLVGGTLLLTHLKGPDNKIYALAQGPVSVGGFSHDFNGSLVQKNHPTAASIPSGATIEKSVKTEILNDDAEIRYVLFDPDFSTAAKIADAINASMSGDYAHALDAARFNVLVPQSEQRHVVRFLTQIENVSVTPDLPARVVVNERTGTVVSGGNVRISPVSITHGDVNVSISTEFAVSQPAFVRQTGEGVRTQVVPNTKIEAQEEPPITVSLANNSSVVDLVSALNKVKASSRDIITILQGIKRAGALHAELVIQ